MIRYFRKTAAPLWTDPNGKWWRGVIYRAVDNAEFLEEYINPAYFGHNSTWYFKDEINKEWQRSIYYVSFAGTGKGSAFVEISEAEAFIELI